MNRIARIFLGCQLMVVGSACIAEPATNKQDATTKSIAQGEKIAAASLEDKADSCEGVTMRVTQPITREHRGVLKATVEISHDLNFVLGLGGFSTGNSLVDNNGDTWAMIKNDATGQGLKYAPGVKVKTHWFYSISAGGKDATSASFSAQVSILGKPCSYSIPNIPIAKM